MIVTDNAIENPADAFVLLTNGKHRDLFIEGLQSIARMATTEMIHDMQIDFIQAITPPHQEKH